jgi:Tfp pilus assembly protein PilV
MIASDRRAGGRGFSIMELIVAFCLIVIGFFTFFSVFSTGAHHAIQTQNRAAANMIAQSYMDEFRVHTFGDPAPAHWLEPEERPVRMVIKDRQTDFVFHKKIEYGGAFVGDNNDNKDRITLTITWKEGVGADQTGGAPADLKAQFPEDNKMLKVEMPVWR